MYRTAANRTSMKAGFTLVEMMIGMSVGLTVMCAVLSAFVFLGRNLKRTGHSQQIETASRLAIGSFKRDAAGATSVLDGTTDTATAATALTTTAVKLSGIPLNSSETGTYANGTQDVIYKYDSSAGTLKRKYRKVTSAGTAGSWSSEMTLMSNLTSFALNFYNATGSATTASAFVKRAEFQYTMAVGEASNATRVSYAAVSPRTSVRNRTFAQ